MGEWGKVGGRGMERKSGERGPGGRGIGGEGGEWEGGRKKSCV